MTEPLSIEHPMASRCGSSPGRKLNSMKGSSSARSGLSLIELVVALTVGMTLFMILVSLSIGSQRMARSQRERVETGEAKRVTATVLGRELRYLAPGSDLYEVGRDSVVLRSFRGSAIVCATRGGLAIVRYRGIRNPDPKKDSLVVLGGGVQPLDLTAPAGSTMPVEEECETRLGERLLRWDTDPLPEPGSLLLLYESGSYHLTGRAFRYRRGESGRQPLTAELFDDERSEIGRGATALELGLWRDGRDSVALGRYRLGLLNGSIP